MADAASKNPITITEANYIEKADPWEEELSFSGILSDDTLIEDTSFVDTAFGDEHLDQADAVSSVNIQAWLNHSPWRITAGWSAVAGLLSMGILTSLFDWRTFFGWQTIILTVLLVDPLWGSIWRFAWGRDGILPLGKDQQSYRFWLPYIKADSPAGRLMGISEDKQNNQLDGSAQEDHLSGQANRTGNNSDLAPFLFRVGVPTLLLTYSIAAALGSAALWFTTIAVVCSIFGWLGRRTWGRPTTLLQTIVSVTLPWVLTVFLLRGGLVPLHIEHGVLGAIDLRTFYSFVLLFMWTIHGWGIALARRSSALTKSKIPESSGEIPQHPVHQPVTFLSTTSQGEFSQGSLLHRGLWASIRQIWQEPALPLLIVGDVGIVILMLVLREPLWLALLAPLWLPTWFAYLQHAPVDRQPIWRLIALLVSAIAVGQTPLA